MAQRVRDILLKISGDPSDAQRDLRAVAEDLKRFDGMTAEATVDVNTTAAERKVAAVKKSVQDVGRMAEQAKVDLQTTAAEARLRQFRTNLENLQRRPVTPKIEIASTVQQIERVEAQLDKLDRRRVNIDIDVDRPGVLGGAGGVGGLLGAGARGLTAGLSGAASGVSGLVAAATRGIPILGNLGGMMLSIASRGGVLGAAMLAVSVVMTVVVLNAVVMLTGAVVALGASFLTAAAGVGVLGVALAAAFGPVLLVAIAAMARFAKVLQAVKQAEDGAAEGAERVRDANQAQAQAQENAVNAAQRVRTTAVEAYRAWRDAAEETSDAIRGIAQAELSRDQARLNVEQAEENLRSLREEAGLTGDSLDGMFKKFTDISFRPTDLIGAIQKSEVGKQAGGGDLDITQAILDLRQARLNEKDAIDGVSDAHTRLEDARTREQEFIQNGIQAYEPYTAAVQANADAQRAVAEAAEQTADARQKQNEALKDLTPRERTLVGVIVDLKKTLTDAFRPATQRIFDGVIDFLKDLGDFAKDSGVRRGLRDIGGAIGGLFRALGRVLRSRETREAFRDFADAAARIIRRLTPVFVSLFGLITTLAQTALPWLLDLIKDVGTAIRNWADDQDKSGIEAFVRRVRRSFNIWIGIVKELWGIVKEFFGDANDSGDELAEHIRVILRRFRLWLQENPDFIKEFFKDAAHYGGMLADALAGIVKALEWMINAKGDIEDVFKTVTGQGKGRLFDPSAERFRTESKPFWWPFQSGGAVFGSGFGDTVPAMLTPGEFVIRRSVAQSIGVGRLNLLNSSGNLAAVGGRRAGMVIQEQHIHLPPAPGHSQLGDPRHQAVQLARELRRRGGQGLTGGGIG